MPRQALAFTPFVRSISVMAYTPLIQGRDYYIEPDGRWVFTAEFLLKRGYCCGNGCRHCPYPKEGGGTDRAKERRREGGIEQVNG